MSISAEGVASTPQDRLQARLADPDTIDSLNRLLDRVDLMAFMLGAVDGLIRRSDTVVESVAQKLAQRTPKILEALGQLTESRALERVSDLVNATMVLAESGMLDPKLVRILGEVGHRLAGAYSDAPSKRFSPWAPLGRSRHWATTSTSATSTDWQLWG